MEEEEEKGGRIEMAYAVRKSRSGGVKGGGEGEGESKREKDEDASSSPHEGSLNSLDLQRFFFTFCYFLLHFLGHDLKSTVTFPPFSYPHYLEGKKE